MKIALIAPSEIPSRRANSIQVMKMADALHELNHEVHVIAPQTGGNAQPGDDRALMRHYGLRHPIRVERLPAHPRLRRYDFSLRALSRAKTWGAEMIYTRLPQAAALASQSGSPVVYEIHDLPQGWTGPTYLRLFLSGRGARRLVLITHRLAEDLQSRFRIPVEPPLTLIAPDGVDLERYANLSDAPTARRRLAVIIPGLSVTAFTAGYTGHLYPGRGGDLLLELARRLPQIQFLAVGGDPQDVEHLRIRTKELGLLNFHPTGFVPNADLPRFQAACDVLLAPYGSQVSASSGGDIARYLSPMKLFEYLACGRAILSSDLAPLREVLNSSNAVLLPPADPQAWEIALLRLLNDPGERMQLGASARRDAAGYSWEGRAARIFSE